MGRLDHAEKEKIHWLTILTPTIIFIIFLPTPSHGRFKGCEAHYMDMEFTAAAARVKQTEERRKKREWARSNGFKILGCIAGAGARAREK